MNNLINDPNISIYKCKIGKVLHFKQNSSDNNNVDEISKSWENSFQFIKEDLSKNKEGLRAPQIGAIHATLGYWETSKLPATIVMPTGTGKTETMLSLLIINSCKKILVVVPTDALRFQIAEKFITLGLLKKLKIINDNALHPFVGIMYKRPKNQEEINEFFDSCNVIVTTMSIVGKLPSNIQNEISNKCSHLFIDEAHHIAAKSWARFKKTFQNNYILQFTATPFRNDDKPIVDKIIFNYPLHKAQEEGYFKPIDFKPVYEWNKENYDKTIALKAIEQLESDLTKGYNHILMARVNSISRANTVFNIYKEFGKYNPVQIHTGIKSTERNTIKEKILKKECRIIVCVDMLGEGFDLPQLKIAAFHDIKKSLPITLQLAGRFTRSSRDNELGNATVVVNIANVEVTEELEQLYAIDSDWNLILPTLSQQATEEQISFADFMNGFSKFPNEIQLQNVRPALSTVIFKTNIDTWNPNNFEKGIPDIDSAEKVYHDVNSKHRILIVITGKRRPIKWGKINDLYELNWTLYLVYWNQEQQLLYINCSENGGAFEKLANALTFNSAQLIEAESVYRCLSGIAQLKINNVGLKEQLDKLLSFTMHTGQDVEPALKPAQLINKIKSNIFCTGFENGDKVSIGCSYKGRVWSKRTSNIEEFLEWSNLVGSKMLDNSINTDNVLKEAIYPKIIDKRPELFPITIEWNEDIYVRNEDAIYLIKNKIQYPFYTFDLELIEQSLDKNIKFILKHDTFQSIFELSFIKKDNRNTYSFKCLENPIDILFGNKQLSLEEYFYNESPIIRFHEGSCLEGNLFWEYKYKGPSYDKNKIINWDWKNVNIKKESQGNTKDVNSIQFNVIKELKKLQYEIIFDDDNAGEIADIITVKTNNTKRIINIELYHLKYSHGDEAGNRINDLYEVCGQAQKCILWKGKGGYELFKRMIKRESISINNGRKSRFEIGDINALNLLKEKSKKHYTCKFHIYIVQPGLSKVQASDQQLELLGVTENHLMETYKIGFSVIANI